jgi:hypothetical protein
MKLIEVISKVILERASDEEPVMDDIPVDVPTDHTLFDFPTEEDKIEYCLGLADGPPDMIPPQCTDVISREREERPREERPREEPPREEPPREEPTPIEKEFTIKKVKEPRKTKTRKAPPEKKQTNAVDVPSDKKTTIKNIEVKPQYSADADIKDINKARPITYVEKVKAKLEKQLLIQPPEVQQMLKQLNITSESMAYLVPLSTETGVLMLKMGLDGLNLPLMMTLYGNTSRLYKAMKNNKALNQNEVKPVTAAINYKEFWKWNEDIYGNWGKWLKNNVVQNFPNLRKGSFPALSF